VNLTRSHVTKRPLKVKEIRLIYKSEKNIEILVIGSTAFDKTNKLKR